MASVAGIGLHHKAAVSRSNSGSNSSNNNNKLSTKVASHVAGGGVSKVSQMAPPNQLTRSLERILEDAHLSGELKLSGRKLRDFPKAAGKYNLNDTVIAGMFYCILLGEARTTYIPSYPSLIDAALARCIEDRYL